ncbi:MAG: hypothetical protein KKC80_00770 [Candidatus Margulisbacteria bacterium]|nr:hypothetical protein [Candidatus Margulisiibacteriota bacterium]MBU1617182.1 hypothetical protein [Candidatus Margulisiibacteriota bacterium]MBU1866906.1 hypothetical protein [Candidatus Margulisiibacteriota bacterium]
MYQVIFKLDGVTIDNIQLGIKSNDEIPRIFNELRKISDVEVIDKEEDIKKYVEDMDRNHFQTNLPIFIGLKNLGSTIEKIGNEIKNTFQI